MKVQAISAITALAGVAAASPTNGYHIAQAREVANLDTVPDMTFTGPLHVGGPNVTFTGTAQSVYQQIHAENPDYNPWKFPEYRERMDAMGITEGSESVRTLAKRQHFECNPVGKQVGNWPMQCAEGIDYLRALNGYCSAPAGPSGCARVSCSHSCGIHLCNDNNFKIDVWCGNLAGDALDIATQGAEPFRDYVIQLKGQVFRDGPPAWNTIVKSNSC